MWLTRSRTAGSTVIALRSAPVRATQSNLPAIELINIAEISRSSRSLLRSLSSEARTIIRAASALAPRRCASSEATTSASATVVVRDDSRLGAVPGAPLGVVVVRLGEPGMRSQPLLRRRRGVRRRAHQRVAEPDRVVHDVNQPASLGRRQVVDEANGSDRSAEHPEVTVARSGEQEDLPGCRRQRGDLLTERRLHARRSGVVAPRRGGPTELEESERVAGRSLDQCRQGAARRDARRRGAAAPARRRPRAAGARPGDGRRAGRAVRRRGPPRARRRPIRRSGGPRSPAPTASCRRTTARRR